MRCASVGKTAPAFTLQCIGASDAEPRVVRRNDYVGRWLALVFYPRDFSFVCPTELTTFSARLGDFQQRNCDVLGVSVDPIEVHREWMNTPPQEGGLGPLRFPLASDPDGVAARAYGIWVEEKQISMRGMFLIGPDEVLAYAVVHSLSVGRSAEEVLRVLDALQSGGLCPAGWTSADGTIDPDAVLRPGSVLGHYRIRRQLGSGSFGSVFAAWDLRLERMVAVKILLRNVSESRDAVFREARAAAQLNHPHVCTVYAVDDEDGLPLIIMEYLEGDLLSQVISQGMARDTALRIAREIASGLAAAHQQNIVHGDFKPANVMVTPEGGAKILDFGLSRCQSCSPRAPAGVRVAGHLRADEPARAVATADPDATREFIQEDTVDRAGLFGTPAYMSPEQAAGLPATAASDVFSLGLTLFELLTGRRALAERSPPRLLRLLRSDDLAHSLAAQVERPYRQLLAEMLVRDAAQRPGIAEVLRRLD